MVRGLPGEVPLPQEQPDRGDKDRHSVPLLVVARLQHPHLHQGHLGVQKVGHLIGVCSSEYFVGKNISKSKKKPQQLFTFFLRNFPLQ